MLSLEQTTLCSLLRNNLNNHRVIVMSIKPNIRKRLVNLAHDLKTTHCSSNAGNQITLFLVPGATKCRGHSTTMLTCSSLRAEIFHTSKDTKALSLRSFIKPNKKLEPYLAQHVQ